MVFLKSVALRRRSPGQWRDSLECDSVSSGRVRDLGQRGPPHWYNRSSSSSSLPLSLSSSPHLVHPLRPSSFPHSVGPPNHLPSQSSVMQQTVVYLYNIKILKITQTFKINTNIVAAGVLNKLSAKQQRVCYSYKLYNAKTVLSGRCVQQKIDVALV